MRFQADIGHVPGLRPKVAESTARAAALPGGLAAGGRTDREDPVDASERDRGFAPEMDRAEADRLHAGRTKGARRAPAREDAEGAVGE